MTKFSHLLRTLFSNSKFPLWHHSCLDDRDSFTCELPNDISRVLSVIKCSNVMIYLNWPLAFVHTTKLINCKYANIFFSLPVDIKEFFKNIKGLEIVNHMNAWKKCSCSKWRNIFWERLIKYFAWKIYLGQSTGGNCLGVGTWRAIILGYLSRGQLSRYQLSGFSLSGGHCLETIIWGQLSWGRLSRGQLS